MNYIMLGLLISSIIFFILSFISFKTYKNVEKRFQKLLTIESLEKKDEEENFFWVENSNDKEILNKVKFYYDTYSNRQLLLIVHSIVFNLISNAKRDNKHFELGILTSMLMQIDSVLNISSKQNDPINLN